MKSYDFEYDGIKLSDMGYVLCSFDTKDVETISSGSQITFETTPTLNGEKFDLANSKYESCITSTFQICKDPCENDDLEITFSEYRETISWLNRKTFHKFRLLEDDYIDLYFEGSFNVSRIEMNGKLIGLELALQTNSPFAFQNPRSFKFSNNEANGEYFFYDISDEEGFTYPNVTITIKEDGDLTITNKEENRNTIIRKCVAGEVITLNYPIITSSVQEHEIQNDFNWEFFRIVNRYRNKRNNIVLSIPCDIDIEYSPKIKVMI